MQKNSPVKITDLEIAKAVISHESVNCILGKEDKLPSKQPQMMVSCIGGTFWGKPGEEWPLDTELKPMVPWLQIVCSEFKAYGPFYKKQALMFYIRSDLPYFELMSKFDKSDFVVRTYELEIQLQPLVRPATLDNHEFHRVTWESTIDYPSLSKFFGLFEKNVYDSIAKSKDFPFRNKSGIKIGGWPTPVQRNRYPGTCDLQIDMTENYMYADSGIGYLSRDGDHWYVQFDSC